MTATPDLATMEKEVRILKEQLREERKYNNNKHRVARILARLDGTSRKADKDDSPRLRAKLAETTATPPDSAWRSIICDTGATMSCIGRGVLRELEMEYDVGSTTKLTDAVGRSIHMLGGSRFTSTPPTDRQG